MKRAIIYYSLTNNTKEAAEKLAKLLSADLYRVETIKPMPTERNKQIIEGGRQAIFNLKPAIIGLPESLNEYDELIIGLPVWAGRNAAPINTVLRNKDICEKTRYIFTLSGTATNDKCLAKLKKKLPNYIDSICLAGRSNDAYPMNDNLINTLAANINK